MIPQAELGNLKIILREKDIPFFSDDELNFYYDKNGGNFNATAYECLQVKAENNTLSISGLTVADSSSYFLKLALRYKPSNSGVLKQKG